MDDTAGPRALLERVNIHRDARGCLFEPLSDTELRTQRNVHVVISEPDGARQSCASNRHGDHQCRGRRG